MPPIAPNPQQSRAGLITALVVFVILFVTSAIFAIYFNTQWQASIRDKQISLDRLRPFASDTAATNAQVIAVKDEGAKQRPPVSGIEYAISQRDTIAKLFSGNPNGDLVEGITNDTMRALDPLKGDLPTKLKAANIPVSLKTDDMLGNQRVLVDQLIAYNTDAANARAAQKAAEDKVNTANAARDTALAAKDKEIAAASQKATDADAATTKARDTIKAMIADIQKASDEAVAKANSSTTVAQTEITKLQASLKKSIDEAERLQKQLARYRLNPTRALLQPAGTVTRAAGNNIVFINLGRGDQVSAGLTFEVYDKLKGLPSLTVANPENPDALLPGKASIEVIRILEGTSECRIIKQGVLPIVEGDLILNLVYNTHTKFAFAVYGEFDLANSGQATPGDADVIRRLVSQWGGRTMDQVAVDTDFLVLGKEPVVLPLPESPTALDQERHDKAVKALDAYQEVRSQAIKYSIPILNQNRFLYFVGYYDQAKR